MGRVGTLPGVRKDKWFQLPIGWLSMHSIHTYIHIAFGEGDVGGRGGKSSGGLRVASAAATSTIA